MLSCRGLVKAHAINGPPVLDNVDLEVAEGEFLAIVGRSGSGKSTLLNVLSTLSRPDAGQVLYRGRDLARSPEPELDALRSSDLAMIFQMHHLLPYLTALENVLAPFLKRLRPVGREVRERAMEALVRVGLTDKASRLPGGLSGGEQQRVAIARALCPGPRILFADEPTGSLDSATGQSIMDLLLDINATGVAVIMVTHEPRYAAMADRIVTLADGRLAAETERAPGRPQETRGPGRDRPAPA